MIIFHYNLAFKYEIINVILMDTQIKPLKNSKIITLEKIAEETVKEVLSLSDNSRPKCIYLHGADPDQLAKVMSVMQNIFERKNLNYHPKIFIGSPLKQEDYIHSSVKKENYPVDVGYYLKQN